MNTADEYRFVTNTNQRSIRYMRDSSAQVWTTSVSTASQNAERFSGSDQPNHDTQASRKTSTYKSVH